MLGESDSACDHNDKLKLHLEGFSKQMDVMVDAYHLWSHGMKAGSMADHISPQYDEDIEGTVSKLYYE
jgi:hypothetical protein